MIPDLPPVHDTLTFLSPLSSTRADVLARWLAEGLAQGGTLIDVGCGWGELALRVAAAAPRSTVVGVDLDPERVAEANRRAGERGLAERATFVTGDGATPPATPVDALIAVGASQVWGGPVEAAQPLGYDAALAGIRAGVVRGARVLYADAIWSRPPTPEATAVLSGRDDEFLALADLVELAATQGFAVAGVQEATLEEWDEFESGFVAGHAGWLAAHEAHHADAPAVRERLDAQRASYLRGYRGVLGMAYLQLLAV